MVSDQRDTCSRWIFLEGFVASIAFLERGRIGCRDTRTCVRSRMHHFFVVRDLMVLDLLDQLEFITILRSTRDQLYHQRVHTHKAFRSSRVYILWMYIHMLLVSR